MKLDLYRDPPVGDTTFGRLEVDGEHFCYTLEDQLREVPGQPVAKWKVKGKTAIPAGTYQILLRDSPRFGPKTLWLQDVEGFRWILIHSGSTTEDVEGCIAVGDQIDREARRISGGKVRGVLARLKARVVPAIERGELVEITVHNPPGYTGPAKGGEQ